MLCSFSNDNGVTLADETDDELAMQSELLTRCLHGILHLHVVDTQYGVGGPHGDVMLRYDMTTSAATYVKASARGVWTIWTVWDFYTVLSTSLTQRRQHSPLCREIRHDKSKFRKIPCWLKVGLKRRIIEHQL